MLLGYVAGGDDLLVTPTGWSPRVIPKLPKEESYFSKQRRYSVESKATMAAILLGATMFVSGLVGAFYEFNNARRYKTPAVQRLHQLEEEIQWSVRELTHSENFRRDFRRQVPVLEAKVEEYNALRVNEEERASLAMVEHYELLADCFKYLAIFGVMVTTAGGILRLTDAGRKKQEEQTELPHVAAL